MNTDYPIYKYSTDDVNNEIARFVRLDNPDSYLFDNFHAHEYNEILIFTKGGGKHNINFQNHNINDNSIHLLAANDLHWVERSMHSTGFAIVYKDQFLQKLQLINPYFDFQTLFDHSRVINLSLEMAADFEFIFKELDNNKTQSAYMLQVIGTLITKIANLDHIQTPTKKIFDPIINEVIKLIEKKFKTKRTIDFYAKSLHITPRTLQNRVKKVSTFTLNEIIHQRLLKEAKKLLCMNQMTVGEIALDLGFKEIAHFSNWFFKHTNCYPLEYKYEND